MSLEADRTIRMDDCSPHIKSNVFVTHFLKENNYFHQRKIF